MITKLITVKNKTALALLSFMLMILTVQCEKDPASLPDGKAPITELTVDICNDPATLSDFTWELDLEGGDKIILRHTQALRTMARSGNVNDLMRELCNVKTKRTSILKRGNRPDRNNIGYASQLEVQNRYVISMFHPNNYPDHFLIYDKVTEDWERWEENGTDPRIDTKGNGL